MGNPHDALRSAWHAYSIDEEATLTRRERFT
jgi:hypothetical protein